jgi:cytochrome d ubiquinol oxidase subunit I
VFFLELSGDRICSATVPRANWPVVPVVFWSFRVMVGLGMLMLTLGGASFVARLRGRLYDWPMLHRFAVAMGPAGFMAVIAGWVTTEVGRQPFTVYGLMRTAHSASPLAAQTVGASLLAFIAVYFAVFGAGVIYMLKLMGRAPSLGETRPKDEPQPIRTAGVIPAPFIDPQSPTFGGKEAVQ